LGGLANRRKVGDFRDNSPFLKTRGGKKVCGSANKTWGKEWGKLLLALEEEPF